MNSALYMAIICEAHSVCLDLSIIIIFGLLVAHRKCLAKFVCLSILVAIIALIERLLPLECVSVQNILEDCHAVLSRARVY